LYFLLGQKNRDLGGDSLITERFLGVMIIERVFFTEVYRLLVESAAEAGD